MSDAQAFKKALIYRAERQVRRELFRAGSPLRTMILAAPLQDGGERERETYENHVHAVGRVLVALVGHMDIVTLIVGRGPDGEHYGFLVRNIAAALSMSQRTVERALRTIHALGWIQTRTRAEEISAGRWIGKAAVRFFSEPFFALIGLGKRLARRRESEYAQRKGGREARLAAMRELQRIGRAAIGSARQAVRQVGELLRPPDLSPGGA